MPRLLRARERVSDGLDQLAKLLCRNGLRVVLYLELSVTDLGVDFNYTVRCALDPGLKEIDESFSR